MKNKNIVLLFSLLLCFFKIDARIADFNCIDNNTDWQNFNDNPAEYLNQIPPKFDNYCNIINSTPFSDQEIRSGNFIFAKDLTRKKVCPNCPLMKSNGETNNKSLIGNNDEVSYLVDNGQNALRSIVIMDQKNLTAGKIRIAPWSDDYWALARGILGFRYNDYDMTNLIIGDSKQTWPSHFKYIQENSVQDYIERGEIDKLSPSEKYDLLIGDKDFTLTKKMWEEGKAYFDQDGKVEEWMGICHGWAAASYMMNRPTKSIVLTSANEKLNITFYPADIKALGSLLWATAPSGESRLIGGRCHDKNPKVDAKGRIISQNCFDSNPGAWHMSVVNQVALARRGMVMDATYDYQVWNQPIIAYSYTYFNPNDMKTSDSLKKAIIEIKKKKKDPFKKYRSDKTIFLVGIEMEVTYLTENSPQASNFDSEAYDSTFYVTYRYDLELNEKYEIIGGEWYRNAHPDFLWTPSIDATPVSVGDYNLTINWNGQGTIPLDWQRSAKTSSSYGQPLARLIYYLFGMSAK